MAMTEKIPLNSVADTPARDPTPADRFTPAARAIAEAQFRRAEIDRRLKEQPKELDGRNGLDPARYGDWEVKGIATDF